MQKIITSLVDDLDGTEIVEGDGRNIHFSLDGQEYEVDLSNDNIGELNTLLAPYINVARKIAKKGRPAGKPSTATKPTK